MITVWVTFDFEALHCWPDAPDEVAFLRNVHRHMFRCIVEWVVHHHDREREFILSKRDGIRHVEKIKETRHTATWSCSLDRLL